MVHSRILHFGRNNETNVSQRHSLLRQLNVTEAKKYTANHYQNACEMHASNSNLYWPIRAPLLCAHGSSNKLQFQFSHFTMVPRQQHCINEKPRITRCNGTFRSSIFYHIFVDSKLEKFDFVNLYNISQHDKETAVDHGKNKEQKIFNKMAILIAESAPQRSRQPTRVVGGKLEQWPRTDPSGGAQLTFFCQCGGTSQGRNSQLCRLTLQAAYAVPLIVILSPAMILCIKEF